MNTLSPDSSRHGGAATKGTAKAFYRGFRGSRGWSEVFLPLSASSAQSAVKLLEQQQSEDRRDSRHFLHAHDYTPTARDWPAEKAALRVKYAG